ncbi:MULTISPECIES: Na/Pi cotransporter family protein [unclassified Phenylobacterium]|uniref:Na/Pi cotransporter family protein n=1 Tax=unclassified Phenylobacterium TaxID=2640670 RepID=UPI000A9F798D|nr:MULTISPECIES: Na/Pi cotransporter family protein [unclassified Phenylobacterium]
MIPVRGRRLIDGPEVAIDTTVVILELAGFAALLLWGVHMVQTGVQRTFGPKLRHFLAGALRTRIHAFAAGAAVTVALQSSTATGLMLTAFSAGGLVELAPALAVMLGANVGSTLVVQALSFDVAVLAPILVLAGVTLFRRWQDRPHDFGRVLIGLGLVLMSLHQFLQLLEPLVARPGLGQALRGLGDYTPLVVIGAALFTWAAHSSVVTVLLAMSLAAKGVVGIETGVALVLGANLGSAINPLLEGGAGSDPASRRLPLGNFLNRLLGLAAAMVAFGYAAQHVVHLGPDPARALANFHTLFNLVLALAFLPFLKPYAALIERMLPSSAEETRPGAPIYLDPHARETPQVALALATREALRMADTVEGMLKGLREALQSDKRSAITKTQQLDDVLDGLNSAIKGYVLSIPVERQQSADIERQTEVLTFAVNLEHAGDLIARDLLSVAERRQTRGVSFSPEGEAELVRLVDRLIANVRLAASLFLNRDPSTARALVAEKEAFRGIEAEGVAAHFDRLRSGNARTVETSSLHLDALRDLKRINSHLVEAAAYPILRTGGELLPSRLKSAN